MVQDPNTKIELSPLSFCDVDHMVEWTRAMGWDNLGTQLTAGSNHIRFDSLTLPGIVVGHYCVQQSIHNSFALPDGMVLFLICRRKLPLVWCGRHLPPTLLGIARSGLEHDVVLHAGWDCYEFLVSEDLILRTEIFPTDFFAKTTQFERAFLPLLEPVTRQFLRQMDSIFRQIRGVNRSPDAAIHQARLFDFLIGGLQEVIDTGLNAQDRTSPRTGRRLDLVKKGRDLIAARLTSNLSVDDLAKDLGVSYRVLNYAFKDSFGVSPYQFLLTQKLHAVRKYLKSSDVSVTEACMTFGFNTPSRFARQYARLFGELPSETRHRYRQHRESPPADL